MDRMRPPAQINTQEIQSYKDFCWLALLGPECANVHVLSVLHLKLWYQCPDWRSWNWLYKKWEGSLALLALLSWRSIRCVTGLPCSLLLTTPPSSPPPQLELLCLIYIILNELSYLSISASVSQSFPLKWKSRQCFAVKAICIVVWEMLKLIQKHLSDTPSEAVFPGVFQSSTLYLWKL